MTDRRDCIWLSACTSTSRSWLRSRATLSDRSESDCLARRSSFTISTSLLLFLVVGILYEAIARHLDEEHEHLLAEIVRVLRHTAGSNRGMAGLIDQVR